MQAVLNNKEFRIKSARPGSLKLRPSPLTAGPIVAGLQSPRQVRAEFKSETGRLETGITVMETRHHATRLHSGGERVNTMLFSEYLLKCLISSVKRIDR